MTGRGREQPNRPPRRTCPGRALEATTVAVPAAGAVDAGRAAPVAGMLGAAVLVLAGVVGRRWLQRVEVRGPSMRPTLEDGDRLLCGPARRLRTGDIVVVEEPGSDGLLAVKRVATLEAGAVVVLGDNRAASRDSRAYGPLPRSAVRGRAWWRYFPAARAGRLPAARTGG